MYGTVFSIVKIRSSMGGKTSMYVFKPYAIWTHLGAEAFMHAPLNNYKGHFEEYLDINMSPEGLNCAQID